MDQDYIKALNEELATATRPQHIKEIKAELVRAGVTVPDFVETATAPVKRETARATRTTKPKQ
jgi:hypothetical protein